MRRAIEPTPRRMRMDALANDLRLALRRLRRAPGFALSGLAALALGVGAVTAVWSVVDAVLLRPLPFADERVVQVWGAGAPDLDDARLPQSAGNYLDLEREGRSFERLAGYRSDGFGVLGASGEPQRVGGAEVTAGFFEVFGARPLLGRAFSAALDGPDALGSGGSGGQRLAVLGEGYWRAAFAADPAAVGRTLTVEGEPATIVGVMPAAFAWPPSDVALWLLSPLPVPRAPLGVTGDLLANRGLRYFQAVGRLRAGVGAEAVAAELGALARRMEEADPANNAGYGMRVVPLKQELVGDQRPGLYLLLAAVALVLLVALADVAGLLLARAAERRGELALRAALGASRSRLARELGAEALVLSALGGAAGLLLARAGVGLFLRWAPPGLPRLAEVAVDARAAALAGVAALAAALLCGAAPAFLWTAAARGALHPSLAGGGRSVSGTRGQGLRRALVVGQVAVALSVLSGAGLLLQSFLRLERVDPGFRGRDAATVTIPLPVERYPDRASQGRFYRRLAAELERQPATRDAALGFPLPMSDGAGSSVTAQPEGAVSPDAREIPALFGTVSPGYFRALGIPLLAGRDFRAADGEDGAPAVVVSASLARRAWPGLEPLGRQLRLGFDESFTVVGVVDDVRSQGLEVPPRPTVYLPYATLPLPYLEAVVPGPADPASVAKAVRAAVRAVDPQLPIGAVGTVAGTVRETLDGPRLRAALLALFSSAALLLAAVGVYGVVSYSVTRRRREIGVRLALGATRLRVLRATLSEGLALALMGAALGLPLTLGLGRLLGSLLFGIGAHDPATLAAAVAGVALVALVASVVPAQRAARTDPGAVLRGE
jgi:predicted permease